jgi:hypothetical protein
MIKRGNKTFGNCGSKNVHSYGHTWSVDLHMISFKGILRSIHTIVFEWNDSPIPYLYHLYPPTLCQVNRSRVPRYPFGTFSRPYKRARCYQSPSLFQHHQTQNPAIWSHPKLKLSSSHLLQITKTGSCFPSPVAPSTPVYLVVADINSPANLPAR